MQEQRNELNFKGESIYVQGKRILIFENLK